MKYFVLTIIILSGVQQKVVGQKKSGWLLYWHDKIIWLEDSLGINADDSVFFKQNANYLNGLNISDNVNANYYEQFSSRIQIYYYRSSAINNKAYDSIKLLPVKARLYQKRDTANFYKSDKLLLNYKDTEIYLEYRGIANYAITKVSLYRRVDKRALRKIKKKK